MSAEPLLFDGHLDLGWNAQLGRDLTLTLPELREQDPLAGQTALVTFSELRAAGVACCLGTLFAHPQTPDFPQGYERGRGGWRGARAQALGQLDQYRRWEDAGCIRLLRSGEELKAHWAAWAASGPGDQELEDGEQAGSQQKGDGQAGGAQDHRPPLGVVLLMEGADPLRDADDLPEWRAAGVRLLGPAWRSTRYAGGTEEPGPLTDRGRDLLTAMRELNVTLDVSHLDDAAFEEALRLQPQAVASHSNLRSLVPGNRQLSGEMVEGLRAVGGLVGVVAHSKFIRPGWQDGDVRASFDEWARHAERLGEALGWEHLGLGSDLDGGFGLEKAPAPMTRYAGVRRLLERLPEAHRAGVAGDHWAGWLGARL